MLHCYFGGLVVCKFAYTKRKSVWKNVYGCHHNTTVLTAAAVMVYDMACYVNKKYSMCVMVLLLL